MTIVSNELPSSELKNVVLRLGGFHTIMSFLGCIGRLMEGSGLQEVLETVYAGNAVGHMLSGKAVTRAIRGHFLVHEVLSSMIVTNALDLTLTVNEINTSEMEMMKEDTRSVMQEKSNAVSIPLSGNSVHLSKMANLFEQLVDGEKTVEEVSKEDVFDLVHSKILEKKIHLHEFRTCKLWIMYMTMIDILRAFIKAERIGYWKLHLHSVKQMLPYLAAAGHNLYVKSAYMYLQKMGRLQVEHPDIYKYFVDGKHVVRRSERYWAGLSTDLVIEQVLMRSVKTTGGLTRGRGLTEAQRNQWLLSMPACSEYNNAMQEFAGISFHCNEQHVENSCARKERDEEDKIKSPRGVQTLGCFYTIH